jgi:inner membrane protein
MTVPPGSSPTPPIGSQVRSQGVRVLLLFGLVLALQVPTLVFGFLVQERKSRHDEAAADIASKWGERQTISGPALVLPWTRRWTENDRGGQAIERTREERLVVLPDSLDVDAKLRTETRRRGIYETPVYRLDATLRGRFAAPDYAKLGIPAADVNLKRAVVLLGVADPRAIQESVGWRQGGDRVEFEPGTMDAPEVGEGIHAELPAGDSPWDRPFEVSLRLNGSGGAYVAPFGRMTTVRMTGDWSRPSFQGPWLPTDRSVTGTGFTAAWRIPALGRKYPQAWTDAGEMAKLIPASAFGLDLAPEVGLYRLCERTTKYALLFFILTFTSLWLLEVLGGRPLHAVHYVLIGAALSIFQLLELALSEHVGFGPAYALATGAVVGVITHYAGAVLGSARRAAGVGIGLAALYGFHYIVLRNEDYALLLGSLLLFVMLAVVMATTRRLQWR